MSLQCAELIGGEVDQGAEREQFFQEDGRVSVNKHQTFLHRQSNDDRGQDFRVRAVVQVEEECGAQVFGVKGDFGRKGLPWYDGSAHLHHLMGGVHNGENVSVASAGAAFADVDLVIDDLRFGTGDETHTLLRALHHLRLVLTGLLVDWVVRLQVGHLSESTERMVRLPYWNGRPQDSSHSQIDVRRTGMSLGHLLRNLPSTGVR